MTDKLCLSAVQSALDGFGPRPDYTGQFTIGPDSILHPATTVQIRDADPAHRLIKYPAANDWYVAVTDHTTLETPLTESSKLKWELRVRSYAKTAHTRTYTVDLINNNPDSTYMTCQNPQGGPDIVLDQNRHSLTYTFTAAINNEPAMKTISYASAAVTAAQRQWREALISFNPNQNFNGTDQLDFIALNLVRI